MSARGRKPDIVFAHANSFAAGTYRVLLDAWRAAGHRVFAIERFGHDPRYPVTSNWPHLRRHLVDFITAHCDAPAILVGHSMGGLISLQAALWRPGLAHGVILLDSPLLTGWRARALAAIKVSGLITHLSPARMTRRRRTQWPSRALALAHFKSKAVFAAWDARVLDDYLDTGFVHHKTGTRLSYDPEVEARTYETLPHQLGALLHRAQPRCPIAFVGGKHSHELQMVGAAAVTRLAGERVRWIDGSHLFPMERPDETAQTVLQLIAGMP